MAHHLYAPHFHAGRRFFVWKICGLPLLTMALLPLE
jgi:hypothetical protein